MESFQEYKTLFETKNSVCRRMRARAAELIQKLVA